MKIEIWIAGVRSVSANQLATAMAQGEIEPLTPDGGVGCGTGESRRLPGRS